MTYKEIKRDLFEMPNDYFLAHCISADFKLGKGIAWQFDKRYNMRYKLLKEYPNNNKYYLDNSGQCLVVDNVFNLVTKRCYYNKPTYNSLTESLLKMKIYMTKHNIKKVAMPTIGCGLDRLNWTKVSEIIQDIFKNTDIEIVICKI